MPNEQNLIPINERTKSEQRRIQSEGGVASGVSRRRKRSLREAADLFLSLPVSDRRSWNRIAKTGVDPEDVDNQMAIIVGLSMQAAKGDAKAAKVLFDLLGDDDVSAGMTAKEDDLSRSLREMGEELSSDDQP